MRKRLLLPWYFRLAATALCTMCALSTTNLYSQESASRKISKAEQRGPEASAAVSPASDKSASSISSHVVNLTWIPGEGDTDFRVYRASGKCLTFGREATALTIPNWTDAHVSSGRTYCYRVTTYDPATGWESVPTNTATVKIP